MKIFATLIISLLFHSMLALKVRGGAKGTGATLSRRRLAKKEPSERECEANFEIDEYQFECKSKIEEGNTEIEDKIDFSVKKSARGVVVKIKYEQETETDLPDNEEDDEETDEADEEDNDENIDVDPELEGPDGDTSTQGLEDEDEDARRLQEVEETETETSYEIVFDRIIEYVPSAGSEAYAAGDEIVQTMSLSQFGDFTTISDNGVSSSFSVNTLDEMAMFRFTVSRASEGEAISANKMKIDFRLTDFPWARDDTYVALIASVETEREVEVEYNDGTEVAEEVLISFADGMTETSGLMPFGELTWATTAEVTASGTATGATMADIMATTTVDGASAAAINTTMIEVVATSSTVDPTTQEIAFSFVGSGAQSASDIYWDPEAGVNYASTSSATSFALGIGFSLIGLLTFFAL